MSFKMSLYNYYNYLHIEKFVWVAMCINAFIIQYLFTYNYSAFCSCLYIQL